MVHSHWDWPWSWSNRGLARGSGSLVWLNLGSVLLLHVHMFWNTAAPRFSGLVISEKVVVPTASFTTK